MTMAVFVLAVSRRHSLYLTGRFLLFNVLNFMLIGMKNFFYRKSASRTEM